ncbi:MULTISPECIES: helix-turn-helix domain-containing protein [Acidobacteriaceae]|uniref:helix-turn-helix domain-containing protein n=1 Tax=Acidobacteriaceae TaxID=204434 RepID=UPI00131CD203|nr:MULTISPECIES: helix-turn-helix domain-containing protein [Acidobacteriaceae]MDW5266926.1 helix-turn-helix domain-containing protein [Edaphobacter sp.]
MDNLYSINAAAEKLGGVSPGTIKLWLSQGKLKRTKIGRRTMISENELRRFRNAGGSAALPNICKPATNETTAVG